jgi:hypothetical protein
MKGRRRSDASDSMGVSTQLGRCGRCRCEVVVRCTASALSVPSFCDSRREKVTSALTVVGSIAASRRRSHTASPSHRLTCHTPLPTQPRNQSTVSFALFFSLTPYCHLALIKATSLSAWPSIWRSIEGLLVSATILSRVPRLNDGVQVLR